MMSNPLGHPGYDFNGRHYKSLKGLMSALIKHGGGDSVWFPSASQAVVGNRNVPIKRYSMTLPKAGRVQTVAEISEA